MRVLLDTNVLKFTFGSHHEPIWQCPRYKTHIWTARISSRTSMLSGCPACARLANKGGRMKQNDLRADDLDRKDIGAVDGPVARSHS